ncbi:hypothetical protein [Polaribacter sp. R77954]|uniref:hypothetical protein n=1 Tax=Polaribacter sp. R77954 TaxID=3093870 RepID=UPI0037C946E4
MKKIITTIMFGILIYGNQYAQEETSTDSLKVRKNAIGVSFGTGFGFDYSRTLKKDKLYVTASYNTLVYSIDGIEQEISGEDLLVDTSLDFKNIDVKLSYHPFSNAFKIVGGIGFFSTNNINVITTFKENITVGEVEFNAADSGNLDINFDWSKTAPYVGLGFGRAVANKRLGFAFDFGSYISSSPEITLDATGIIEQTADQEGLLNESFESFKFIPYGSFRLSYSF